MVRKLLYAFGALAVFSPVQAQFADVPAGHYAETSVLKLTQLGILTGFPDGLFRGERPVDRYELALILSRMWDNWSTEQLGDVWSEIVSLEAQLAELRSGGELIRRNEVSIAGLEANLAGAEERILALDDRTANIRLTREDVSELETSLGTLRRTVQRLQGQLRAGNDQRTQDNQGSAGRLAEASARLDSLGRQLSEVSERFGAVETQMDALRDDVDQFPRDLEAEMGALRDEFIGVRDALAWEGDLTVAAGILGDGAAYSLATGVTTQRGRLRATLDERGLEAQASGRVFEGFELGGRYQRTEVGELGLASAELAATPALRVGVTGSSDQGLTFGGFLRHLGDQPGAALPGLDVLVGVSSGQSDEKGINRLLVQGSAGLTLGGGRYAVRPAVLYRRETGLQGYSGFVGELGVGLELAQDMTLNAVGRYGLFTDLTGNPSQGIPEGEVRVDFGSGLSVEVEASAGLPDGRKLGTFADGNPLLSELLEVGVRVGYTVSLEELP